MTMRRRKFLAGLGGVAIGLPFLQTLAPRSARGDLLGTPKRFVYSQYFNGIGRGRTFYPAIDPGSLSPESFDVPVPGHPRGVSCLSPLRDYADRLLVLRGIHTAPGGYRIHGHVHANAKRLTAAQLWINEFGDEDINPNSGVQTADGISIDQEIARQLNPPGREALTLRVGYGSEGSRGAISYRGPNDIVTGEPHPFRAYERIVGLAEADAEARAQIMLRRRSIIDLVRDDLDSLRRLHLSRDDERMMDLHLTSLRELETSLESEGLIPLPAERTEEMAALEDSVVQRDSMTKTVGRMHMDVIAMAVASDYTRAATLQWSRSASQVVYRWDGMDFNNPHHPISHGNTSNGSSGDPIDGWQDMMDLINDWHAEQFRYLLERLDAYEEEDGTVLDNTIAMWSNAMGRGHQCWDVPHVIAGSAGGYLRTGRYVNLSSASIAEIEEATRRGESRYREDLPHDAPNNKLLTTILNAVGCQDEDGGPVRMFGVPNGSDDFREQLQPGEFEELKA
jgi:hypothetical protein